MTASGLIEKGKDAIVGELVTEVASSPNIREAGSQLAKTALTVTKAINVFLLPLAAVNFAYDKAKEYFLGRFQEEFKEKLKSIPDESIVEPKASLAGPILQGIAFTHDEQNIKEMYLSLLSMSMDARVNQMAHPSFVEIIRQLNSDEARFLKHLLPLNGYRPIVEVRLIESTGYWRTVMRHLLPYIDFDTGAHAEHAGLSAMVDNFVRLGLVHVTYNQEIKTEKAYDWVDERPEINQFKNTLEHDDAKIACEHGIIGRTAFGKQFAEAVGLIQSDS